MNKQVSVIKSITLNNATFNNETLEPTYINFFFGKNGTGKTTIGRQINERIGLVWNEDFHSDDYEILVYNKDFIDNHFQTLDKLQGIFSVTDNKEIEQEIKELESKRDILTKEKNRIEKEITENKNLLDNADNFFQKTCVNKTSDIRKDFRSAIMGFYKNPSYSTKILSTKPQNIDEEHLREIYRIAYEDDESIYEPLKEIELHYNILEQHTILSEPIIITKKNTEYAKFIEDINALSWIDEGHEKFHKIAGGFCPYCHQELPINFEELFYSCFDDEYQKKLNKIRDFLADYSSSMSNVYNNLSETIKQDTLPELKDKIETLKLMYENFLRIIRENINIIYRKLKEPGQKLQLESIYNIVHEINKIINECNAKINNHNEIVKNVKQYREKIISYIFAFLAYELKDEVSTYRQASNKYQKIIHDLENELGTINYNLRVTGKKLLSLTSALTSSQSAITAMNTLLHNSGFEGFEIVKSDLAENAYKVVRENKETAVQLSDGEIHFLAFLYFYSMVKGLKNDGTHKSKIVVIDDPVSSLDESSLFIISSLVREMIETCFYNIEHMGIGLKGDYDIKQIFILTHNALFHRNITLNQVERYKGVNFYLVRKSNNYSTIKHCIRHSSSKSTTVENFNPVTNAYTSLWNEYQIVNSEISLINVIHSILNHYFLDICNKSYNDLREEILIKNRNKFIDINPDGTEDNNRFYMVSSMLMYMNSGFEKATFANDGSGIKKIRNAFKDIFYSLGQGEHFEMMMEITKEQC